MSALKNRMPEQPPAVRRGNFDEVALGYDAGTAMAEAQRCLQCKTAPCRQGCPVEVDIPAFIGRIRDGEFAAAIDVIKAKNSLPAVCGRVCPQEDQCEKYCVRGLKGQPVAIGRLERFAADHALRQGREDEDAAPASAPGKVAVVGGGPSGLTAAGDLARLGYKVTVFEALHAPGGVLMYGIPEFRLPKAIVRREIAALKKLGVEIIVNAVIGKTFTIDELLAEEGYDAVFIGTGAGLPHFMDIPGENYNGVYSANEFLTRVNLMKAYKFPDTATPVRVGRSVAVVGAGNVAMDSARTALRLGAESVYIVYRRSEEEMPARAEELEHAKEEGVEFRLLTAPVRILGDEKGWVTGIECVRMALGEPDRSGRRRPVPVLESEYRLPVDTVVMAIGQGPNPLVQHTTPGLDTDRRGNIVADECGATSKPGVFAGGDIVTGAATVILAMGAGKKAAAGIHEYVRKKKNAH
jgi:glutamate synthase (NADPH/NADH) small chain